MSGNYNNDTVKKILVDTQKQIDNVPHNEGGVLARIFRKLLIGSNVNIIRWNNLMDAFERLVRSGQTGLRADASSIRGNTTKFLCSNSFTWKNFTRAMVFLQIRRLRIVIEAEDKHGRVYTVEEPLQFNLGQPVDFNDEDEDNNKEVNNHG